MFDAVFNNIINTLIRDLPRATQQIISVLLFFGALIFFNKSFRVKDELRPIKLGWAVLAILSTIMSVLYISL
jgi:hypothetical protein